MSDIVTAAMIVIGDEILSGRTKDRNIGHLADIMTAIGVDLKEVRIVADEEDEIVAAVNALRHRYDYVFTTGGIGPTHDDITADSVAKAFGVPCDYDAEGDGAARRELRHAQHRVQRRAESAWRACRSAHPTSTIPSRQRRAFASVTSMSWPACPPSSRPCSTMSCPTLKTGAKLLSATVPCPHGEGIIGGPFAEIQKAHPDTIIGSYPKYLDGSFWTELVVRARSQQALDAARLAVEQMVAGLPKAK